MKIAGRVAVVTGGGGGIGAALAAKLAEHGARVVVADLDAGAADNTAERVNAAAPGGAVGVGADAAETAGIRRALATAEREFGPVELYFANAGMTGPAGLDIGEDDWDRVFDVNVRAHIRAAQLLVPRWARRGHGYFIATASAAGLLTQVGSAAYSTTKHAAVGFAEWLSVAYGDSGVRVSCLCPMGVDTELLYAGQQSTDPVARAATRAVTTAGEVLEPAAVAQQVLEAVDAERFLILPHPAVLDMYRQKGSDYDRWLRGMRRYQRSLLEADG